MAGFFQQFLKGAADGFLGSPNLKDYKHASKTFLTNAYGNAPKFKWLFHVYFSINELAVSGKGLFPSTTNHGLLVKSIELPKFSTPLTEMNQYNRKRYIHTKITYDPIRITFHDDNANQIRNMWHAYYSYYFQDPSNPGGLQSAPSSRTQKDDAVNKLKTPVRNIYSSELTDDQLNWGYYGESGQASAAVPYGAKERFFNTIRVYGFNQHNFALYELINPSIESFGHDTYSYGETNGTMECNMSVKFETVKYYEGALNGENPNAIVDRFAEEGVYDKELSPIARNGNNRNILGQGGLVDSVNGILTDISSGNLLGAIQTAGRVSRTFKNGQQILQAAKTELVGGVIGAVSNPGSARTQFNWPAQGATAGPGQQVAGSSNLPGGIVSQPQPVPSNNPIR